MLNSYYCTNRDGLCQTIAKPEKSGMACQLLHQWHQTRQQQCLAMQPGNGKSYRGCVLCRLQATGPFLLLGQNKQSFTLPIPKSCLRNRNTEHCFSGCNQLQLTACLIFVSFVWLTTSHLYPLITSRHHSSMVYLNKKWEIYFLLTMDKPLLHAFVSFLILIGKACFFSGAETITFCIGLSPALLLSQ